MAKVSSSLQNFIKNIPSGARALSVRLVNGLLGNTASTYKYVFQAQTEDFFGVMLGLVGFTAAAVTPAAPIGWILLGIAGTIGAARFPSFSERKAEKIFDINLAGQNLTGARADLYKLDLVQQQVEAITRPFNKAAELPSGVTEKVQGLIAGTEKERDRVKTSDNQPYAFIRTVTRLEKI